LSTDLTHGKSSLRRRDLGDLFCCTPLRFLPPDDVCKETGAVRVKDNQSSVTLVLSHHFIFYCILKVIGASSLLDLHHSRHISDRCDYTSDGCDHISHGRAHIWPYLRWVFESAIV
jgi:hypothetical protein